MKGQRHMKAELLDTLLLCALGTEHSFEMALDS